MSQLTPSRPQSLKLTGREPKFKGKTILLTYNLPTDKIRKETISLIFPIFLRGQANLILSNAHFNFSFSFFI